MEKSKYCNKMFEAGNKAQLEEMIKNDYKDRYDNAWNDINLLWAVKKIREHTPEMIQIVLSPAPIFNLNRLRKLASDVANLAHMVILKCDKLLEGKSS